MALPEPRPGLVINYAYLWRNEALRGQEEGVKYRPCAIVLTVADRQGDRVVVVAPITHVPPFGTVEAIEIPHDTKRRLGLDDDRSWIVLNDLNEFLWPGPDLSPVPGHVPSTFAYGLLPNAFFLHVKARISTSHAKTASA